MLTKTELQFKLNELQGQVTSKQGKKTTTPLAFKDQYCKFGVATGNSETLSNRFFF